MWTELFEWLGLWLFVYIIVGIFLPYAVARGVLRYEPNKPSVSLKQFYTGGELGPVSFMLSLHVGLDVYKGKALSNLGLLMLCAPILLLGFLGVWAWANAFCRHLLGKEVNVDRVWRDTSSLAFCVCIVGVFTQVFLTVSPYLQLEGP